MQYALKSTAPAILNAAHHPVYAEHIDTELTKLINQGGRLEYDVLGAEYLREKLIGVTATGIAAVKGLEPELAKRGLDTVIVVEVQTDPKSAPDDPAAIRLFFGLVNVRADELVAKQLIPVENRFSLDSFTWAVRSGMAALVRAIPFDGSVSAREGEKIVLDRGIPTMKPGLRLSVSTLEKAAGGLVFDEVGEIVVIRAERDLAFARVVNERAPGAIARGMKLRPAALHREEARRPASIEADIAFKKGTYGVFDLGVGASLVEFNNAGSNAGFNSREAVYPGASLNGEAWLTRRLFASFGFDIALASLSTDTGVQPGRVTSNVNALRAAIGYRFRFLSPDYGPEISFKAGYARQQFQMDATNQPLSLGTTTYSGLLLGGSLRFPVVKSLGLAFDFNALLFPSVSESPVTSGSSTRVSGIDFSAGAYYNLAADLDIAIKAVFQSYSADFDGTGNRSVPLLSSSQSSRAIVFGVSKYF